MQAEGEYRTWAYKAHFYSELKKAVDVAIYGGYDANRKWHTRWTASKRTTQGAINQEFVLPIEQHAEAVGEPIIQYFEYLAEQSALLTEEKTTLEAFKTYSLWKDQNYVRTKPLIAEAGTS